jgi:L-seryl-tRNA(Ser) seleniumtransferase
LPPEITWPERSAQSSLAAGANLVLLRGDGLVGGPACGILAGDRDIVRKIADQPLFPAWQLDARRSAALAATLECHLDRSPVKPTLPLIELLTTPLENLRNRAERLAAQLAAADGIRSAEVVSLLSHCDGRPTPAHALRSFGVTLRPANGDVTALERRLISAPEPIIGRTETDCLVLDLRTVLPRHDQAVVRALASQPASRDSASASEPAV